MANNPYNNKVQLADGTVLIDLTGTTATADKILQGYGAYGADGSWMDGTAVAGSGSAIVVTDTLDEHGGTIRNINAVSLDGDTVRPDVLLSGYTAHNSLGEAIVGTASGGGSPTLQAKTHIEPTESSQTITADTGYDGLSSVQIDPIDSEYVGSDVTRRSSSDLTASGATVTVPAGYYASQASKAVSTMTLPTNTSSSATSGYTSKATVSRSTSDQYINIPTGYNSSGAYYKVNAVANGSATAPSSISGTSATVSTGTNTLTLTKSVSVTPTVTAGYVSSGTAGNSSVSLTASVTTQAAQTIHPSTSNQTISSGRYLTGTQTFNAVTLSNLTAENIKSGVVVKVGDASDDDCVTSVTGTYSGGGGSGIGTLLNTTSIGTVSTTSTQAASLNVSLSVSGVNNYDLLIVESSVNTVTNGRHTCTVGLIFLTAGTTVGTKNGATIATAKLNMKASSNGTTTTSTSTTAYGIYPNSCSVSDGTATIPMYRRYNSTSTGTMNGTYTARVYGVNLYNLIGG